MSVSAPLLSCRGVSKRFGEVWANRGVDLEVRSGETLALLGENGAGKSTLMSILAGRYRPDEGEIRVKGEPVSFASPADALARGIGMVYQRFMLVEPLSVAENLLLAARGRGRRETPKSIRAEMADLSARYGLAVDPGRRVASLSMGERQRVEIMKLLVQSAEMLIFDEPTAVLAQPEVDGFFKVLARLRDDGRGVVFITHKLEEVLASADRIAILRRGRIMATLAPEQVESRRELARLMVGREFVLKVDKPEIAPGELVLEAAGLRGQAAAGRPGFEDVVLSVRRGEILSIVGVAGNGQSELALALAGLAPFGAGDLRFLGRSYTPREWLHTKSKVAYVPEDRHHLGSVPSMDLAENFLLTRPEAAGGFWLDRRRMTAEAEQAVRDFGIRASSMTMPAGQLSGGNLQKLILARELARDPALFIAESPTQGLDVGATEDIWAQLIKLRERAAIILFTGDLREALSLSDRIAVIFRGRILDVVSARDAEAVARIGLLMAGSDGTQPAVKGEAC